MTDGRTGVALVTGASSGFGRHTALALARAGWTTFAGLRDIAGRNRAAAAELTGEPGAHRGQLEAIDLDVTDDVSTAAAVEHVLSRAGRIDLLVNNAGRMIAGLLEGCTPAQAQELYAVNVFGAFRIARAVLPAMRRRRSGLIVWISSRQGRLITPATALYASSKHAIEAMAEGFRYELAGLGIDSVVVQPGAFLTSLGQNMSWPAEPERLADYGELADLPRRFAERMLAELSRPDAVGPGAVAEAVVRLAAMPVGERPLRTVIDPQMAPPVEAINDACAQVERQIMTAAGLGALLQPVGSSPT